MKKATLFLLLFSFCSFMHAQIRINEFDKDKCNKVEAATGTSMSLDANGNIYLINGAILYKLDPEGNLLYKYCNYLLGDIRSVDADNPLKVMVFYYNEAKIVFLDEKLVPIMEPLDLFEKNHNRISLATYSTDNTIWIYDAVLQDLINIDFHLKELSRTHLTFDDLHPNQLFSLQEKQLVLNNPETGVLFFDAFGTYLKTLSIQSIDHTVQVDGTTISYLESVDVQDWIIDGPSSFPCLTTYTYALNSKLPTLAESVKIALFPHKMMQVMQTRTHIYFIDDNLQLNIYSL